jgi:hypothetical protein
MKTREKAIDYLIQGIKCDNPRCDYKDMTVQFKDYKKWVNVSCPKCGSNLLTDADMKLVKRLVKVTKIINFFYKMLGINIENEPKYRLQVKMDGTGEQGVKFSEIEKI